MTNVPKSSWDKYLAKYSSKKLQVMIVAIIFVLGGFLTGEQWTVIALVYLVSQAAVDATIQKYLQK